MAGDIEVRTSKVSGRGVFALRRFSMGEVVLRWDTSNKIPRSKLATVPEPERHFLNPYDDQSFVLLPEPERFVNHSCSSNTRVVNFCDVAVRDIMAGEEITSDYRSGGVEIDFECNCGAAECCNRGNS